MKIENIPGFEKTPDKVEYISDAMKVYSIAGMTPDINDHLFENAKKLKEILDFRRRHFKNYIRICKELPKNYSPDEIKEISVYLTLYTGHGWKELVEEADD